MSPRQINQLKDNATSKSAPINLKRVFWHWLIIFVIASAVVTVFLFFNKPPKSEITIYQINHPPANVAGVQTTDQQAADQTVKLIAVGDIMLSRNVEQKMISKNDWTYPFRETYQLTTVGDIVFGNLESPLLEGPVVQTGQMVFRADPKAVAGLTYGGFNVLSLANNHIKNQGRAGIEKTMAVLDQAQIAHAGAGLSPEQARQPAILEKNGIKFAFLAYTYNQDSNTAGASSYLSEENLISDLEKLNYNADIIIVSMHAGTEYANQPNQKQKDFAHTAIDHGARLVIGHHPHVVQTVEKYKDGYIFYSLGNFVFDQMWSEPTREGAVAKILFKKNKIENIEIIPIKIFDFSQPRVLSAEEGRTILDRMGSFTF